MIIYLYPAHYLTINLLSFYFLFFQWNVSCVSIFSLLSLFLWSKHIFQQFRAASPVWFDGRRICPALSCVNNYTGGFSLLLLLLSSSCLVDGRESAVKRTYIHRHTHHRSEKGEEEDEGDHLLLCEPEEETKTRANAYQRQSGTHTNGPAGFWLLSLHFLYIYVMGPPVRQRERKKKYNTCVFCFFFQRRRRRRRRSLRRCWRGAKFLCLFLPPALSYRRLKLTRFGAHFPPSLWKPGSNKFNWKYESRAKRKIIEGKS